MLGLLSWDKYCRYHKTITLLMSSNFNVYNMISFIDAEDIGCKFPISILFKSLYSFLA
jgi:hypothetical protein